MSYLLGNNHIDILWNDFAIVCATITNHFMSYSMTMMSMRTFHRFHCYLYCYPNLAAVPKYERLHRPMPMPALMDKRDSMKHNWLCDYDRSIWLTALPVLYAKCTPKPRVNVIKKNWYLLNFPSHRFCCCCCCWKKYQIYLVVFTSAGNEAFIYATKTRINRVCSLCSALELPHQALIFQIP